MQQLDAFNDLNNFLYEFLSNKSTYFGFIDFKSEVGCVEGIGIAVESIYCDISFTQDDLKGRNKYYSNHPEWRKY